jgi:hypothetical protein
VLAALPVLHGTFGVRPLPALESFVLMTQPGRLGLFARQHARRTASRGVRVGANGSSKPCTAVHIRQKPHDVDANMTGALEDPRSAWVVFSGAFPHAIMRGYPDAGSFAAPYRVCEVVSEMPGTFARSRDDSRRCE